MKRRTLLFCTAIFTISVGETLSSTTRVAHGAPQSPAAQAPDRAASANQTPTPETVAARIATVTAELERARGLLDSAQVDGTGKKPESLERSVQLLERLEASLRQLSATLFHEQECLTAREDARAGLDALLTAGLTEAPPYGVLLLDEARDVLENEQRQLESLRRQLSVDRDGLIRAREDAEKKDSTRRQVKEALEQAPLGPERDQAERLLRVAEFEARLARTATEIRGAGVRNVQVEIEAAELKIQTLTRRVDAISRDVSLGEDEESTIALELARREETLRRDLTVAEESLVFATSRWTEARREADRSPGTDPVPGARAEALRTSQQLHREQISAIGRRLERLARIRETWERRFAIFRDQASATDIEAWNVEAREWLDQLVIEERLVGGFLTENRRAETTLDGQIEGTDSEELRGVLTRRREILTKLDAVHEGNLASIVVARRLSEHLIADTGARAGEFDIREFFARVWASSRAVWRHELTAVDDRPITVGKVLSGVLLLLIGIVLSRVFSRLLGKRIFPRLRLAEGSSHALQSIVFYVFVVLFALFALRVINVPLTAFTIAGGALAIGIGFGSQNIVNNFISGLILLVERPVRAGDLIQIADLYGLVAHIGLRSTRVRTGENVEIIVPNSSFVEQNVINWTLTGTDVRVSISVGVIYGSPTEEVREILMQAARDHKRVLKNPEPLVLFTNFGDNSLDFQIHFWIKMRNMMDRRRVESDLRFKIDAMCREAGIVIAFPQRDVHLDSARPLEVRVLGPETRDAGA